MSINSLSGLANAYTPKQKNLIDKIYNEAHLIGHLVGLTKLTELHSEWARKMIFSKSTYVLKAHRGSYKSTILALVIAIIMVMSPNKSIIFLRKTDTDVMELVAKVTNLLETDTFQYFSQILHGRTYQFNKKTSFEVDTTLRTDINIKSQLLAIGLKGSLTGKHADIVIVDDIVNRLDRVSRAEREVTKSVWMELQNVKNRDGRCIAIGTTWHPEDAFSLMPDADVYTCYETGLMSKEEIEETKNSMTPALFAANYELKFMADEDAIFTDIRFERDLDLPENVDAKQLIEHGICHLDAGYSGSDKTAFTIMKQLSDGRIIAFGKMWDKHVKHCMSEIITLKNYYLAGTLYLESNGDKGYLAKEFRERGVNCMTYHEKMNKHLKISTHLYGNWKDIYWLDKTDPNYVNQIMDYCENADHDDCADSAATCCRILKGNKVKAINGLRI